MTPATPGRKLVIELLVQLHFAPNSDVANPIRDEMNELWYELDDDDRELFDELSEDLFILEGKRMIAPLAEGESAESVLRQVALAFREGRPADTLAGLRKLPDFGPEHAYVFGLSWEKLGFHRGAICFYDYAYSRQPKPAFLVSSLEALMTSGQMVTQNSSHAGELAEDVAEAIVARLDANAPAG